MKKRPVSIFSGFLGSGKSTVLKHLLDEGLSGEKIVLIENEFGEIGIDGELFKDNKALFIEMNNGCLCCSVKGDMIKIISELTEKKEDFDRVIIECTGIADPLRVAEVFVGGSRLSESFHLNGIISVVDSFHYENNFLRNKEIFLQQISFSELIILNKVDLIDGEEEERLKNRLKEVNSKADVLSRGIDTPVKVNFSSLKGLELTEDSFQRAEHISHHEMDSVSIQEVGVLNPPLFESFLNYLSSIYRDNLIRSKGVINLFGVEKKMIFQGVYRQFEFALGDDWEEGDRLNRVVFIGKSLNEEAIQAGLKNCLMTEEDILKASSAINKN